MSRTWEPMLTTLATERYPRLVGHAMMLVGSRADAEDLVQEALVATFVGRRRFDGIGQAEQHVRRAIVTKFINRYHVSPGHEEPRALTVHDIERGTSMDLIPAAEGSWLETLTGWVVAK